MQVKKGGRKPCVCIGETINGRKVIKQIPKRGSYNALRYLVKCVECGEISEVFGFSLKTAGCKRCAAEVRGIESRGPRVNNLCKTEKRYTQGCRCDGCRAAHAEYNRQYRKTVKGRKSMKAMNLRKFGLTLSQFDGMLRLQSGCCDICHETMDPPCVDHDHDTGIVRGLLCHSCNRGIGLLGDSPERLKNAISYITHHQKVLPIRQNERG